MQMKLVLAPLFFLASAFLAEALPIKRCVNLANALEAPFEGAWGYEIEDAHIAAIAADGFDTIRLPVRFQAGYGDDRIDPALLDRVDHVIRVAFAHGLNVVLDFHHFFELMEDPEAHSDLSVDIWKEVSDHYAGWSDGLMFELLNEPEDQLTTERADALYDRVFPFLLAAHPDRWVIVGGGEWSSRSELWALRPKDSRTAFTFHYYTPFEFTHQRAAWVEPVLPDRPAATPEELSDVDRHFAELAAFPAPLFLGEFGAFNEIPAVDRAPWMAAVRRASEAAGIGWCHWGYVSGFRIVEDDLTWISPLREALFAP